MFQQNASKLIFVCVTNSQNVRPLFHKSVISHNPLQKIYLNLARKCKNEFNENEIKFNWLKLLKKFCYGITDRRTKKPPLPVSDWLIGENILSFILLLK